MSNCWQNTALFLYPKTDMRVLLLLWTTIPLHTSTPNLLPYSYGLYVSSICNVVVEFLTLFDSFIKDYPSAYTIYVIL